MEITNKIDRLVAIKVQIRELEAEATQLTQEIAAGNGNGINIPAGYRVLEKRKGGHSTKPKDYRKTKWFSNALSKSMKAHWAKLTPEQRKAKIEAMNAKRKIVEV